MTLADLLLKVAGGLAGLLGLSSNLRRARNHDAADLFRGMARCLATIADKLDGGEEPVKECHELLYYAQAVPQVIRRIAGFWNKGHAGNLGGALMAAVDAPSRVTLNLQHKASLALPVFNRVSPAAELTSAEAEIRKIREASGLFLAASNIVRAGAKL